MATCHQQYAKRFLLTVGHAIARGRGAAVDRPPRWAPGSDRLGARTPEPRGHNGAD